MKYSNCLVTVYLSIFFKRMFYTCVYKIEKLHAVVLFSLAIDNCCDRGIRKYSEKNQVESTLVNMCGLVLNYQSIWYLAMYIKQVQSGCARISVDW